MATVRANSSEISIAIERELSKLCEEENERMKKAIREAALYCRKTLRETSPHDSGDYAKGWSLRVKTGKHAISAVIYNSKKPELTHLLEESHVIRNKYGVYGRTSEGNGQIPHITKASELAEEYLIDKLVEGIG